MKRIGPLSTTRLTGARRPRPPRLNSLCQCAPNSWPRLARQAREASAPSFASLTVGGCKDDPEDPGHTLGLVCEAEAQFWTVYARDNDGCSEAITDCGARAEADQVGQELSTLSGLEIEQ